MAIPRTLIKKGTTTIDLFTTYGFMVEDFPFLPIKAKPKNIYERSYYDQDGNYTYIPATLKYEPQVFDLTFVYKGSKNGADTALPNFINYIIGTEFTIYNEHAKVGRAKCHIENINEKPKFYRWDKDVIAVTMTIKCNDPVTNTTLTLT